MENLYKALEILFEDEDYIFINKSAGMLTLPDRFDTAVPNLHHILKSHYGDIFIVHRIDKQTSGLIAFAKNALAHKELNIQFESHQVQKKYLAIVHGVLNDAEGVIDLAIGENSGRAGTMKIDAVHGKKSVTRYRVIEKYLNYTLVEAEPLSGRTHQIRVHFKAIGHPLAVDELYGHAEGIKLSSIKRTYKIKSGEIEKPLIARLTLHAKSLRFYHFRRKEPITIEAPVPKDFGSTVKQLKKLSPPPVL
ncbi:RluA family pseudouridine synthase [bacterium]|nr:RluA family pseudouridine synthase [bacterium]